VRPEKLAVRIPSPALFAHYIGPRVRITGLPAPYTQWPAKRAERARAGQRIKNAMLFESPGVLTSNSSVSRALHHHRNLSIGLNHHPSRRRTERLKGVRG